MKIRQRMNVRFEFALMWSRRRKCCIIKSPPFDVTKIWGDKGGRKRQREDANGTETTQEVKSDEIKFKRKEKNVKIDCRNVQVVRGGFSVFFRKNLYDDDADISFFGSGMDKTKKNHLIKTKKKVYTLCLTEILCFSRFSLFSPRKRWNLITKKSFSDIVAGCFFSLQNCQLTSTRLFGIRKADIRKTTRKMLQEVRIGSLYFVVCAWMNSMLSLLIFHVSFVNSSGNPISLEF